MSAANDLLLPLPFALVLSLLLFSSLLFFRRSRLVVALASRFFVVALALAFVVALASRYPKASALGLTGKAKIRALAPEQPPSKLQL
jgi:hypothetical protein